MNSSRYEKEKKIGKGSMGEVYKALDTIIDRFVALKVLRKEKIKEEIYVKRFLKEAKIIGRLKHPNIVTVYDVIEDHDDIYISMEFVDGKPLDKIIGVKYFGLEEVINLGIQIAKTLDYAHQQGVVHRDIKPGNIIVKPDDSIIITDFGIAHIQDSQSTSETRVDTIMGTPNYMAPEQYKEPEVDGRADLFSLGVILYELATGSKPFRGKDLPSICKSVTLDNPAEPIEKNPEIPKDLSDIIMKCLEKAPEDRFQTGRAMVEALEECSKQVKEEQEEDIDILDDTTKINQEEKKKTVRSVIKMTILFCLIVLAFYYIMTNIKDLKKSKPSINSPPVSNATLNLDSKPSGANIMIDGIFKGRTPLSLNLPGGKKYKVRLSLSNYVDWENTVPLEEEGERSLTIPLSPK